MSGLTAHFLFGLKWSCGQQAFGREQRSPNRLRQKKMAAKLDEIRNAAERVASTLGLDVVDVEFAAAGREQILRVTLEKNAERRAKLKAQIAAAQEAGLDAELAELPEALREGTLSRGSNLSLDQLSFITHEDCAAFSRDFGVLLDVEDLVPGSEYLLEASSPGLDRKLKKPEDFRRFMGGLVKVQTFEPVRNNRHWQGRLTEAAGEEITIDLGAVKQNSKSRKTGVSVVEIALANIEKAQLIPEI
jgi:ribosome maturation factor RimP